MRPTALRFFTSAPSHTRRPEYLPRSLEVNLFADAPAATPSSTIIPKPRELDWWDWTVLLLQTAAEIEHGLLVQYLYAGYSLALDEFEGTPPADAATLTKNWRRTFRALAREEMAHLLTVQNLLHAVRSGPTLERQPFPSDSPLQPFPFVLEPLTSSSLAKYIVAEMPASAAASIAPIIAEAEAAAGQAVNRVGPVYMTLVDIFGDPGKLRDEDLDFTTAATVQALPGDWRSDGGGLLGGLIESRESAERFLTAIGEQGEGPWVAAAGATSHFDRLLQIYRAFPNGAAGPPAWTPARAVPANPTTFQDRSPGSIDEPVSLLWAQFGNVRYRILLAALAHSLSLPGPLDAAGARTPKGLLVDWVFEEMVGNGEAGLGALADLLSERPRKASGGPERAALPFELPYSTVLPPNEPGRWRLHKALVGKAIELEQELRTAGQDGPMLQEYAAMDAARLAFLASL